MATTKLKLQISHDLLICNACGTQFSVTTKDNKTECKICDDPRQFVPPEGQTFTTLAELSQTRKNIWWQDKKHGYVWSVKTEPSFAIGNRAELIQTSKGNVLWDLIPFLDQETVDKVMELGGLKAIIISHPHYYSTWADWSRTFSCPVYVGNPDKVWLERLGGYDSSSSSTVAEGADLRFLTDTYTDIDLENGSITGLGDNIDNQDTIKSGDNEHEKMTAIITGGHFPGSLLLHYTSVCSGNGATNQTTNTNTNTNAEDDDNEKKQENLLFIADTIVTVPSATNPIPGKPGVISFSFFWSIPNRIPLPPDEITRIWKKVAPLKFETCFGAFKDMDVYTLANETDHLIHDGTSRKGRDTGGVKGRLLESCKIFIRGCGWTEGTQEIFDQVLS